MAHGALHTLIRKDVAESAPSPSVIQNHMSGDRVAAGRGVGAEFIRLPVVQRDFETPKLTAARVRRKRTAGLSGRE